MGVMGDVMARVNMLPVTVQTQPRSAARMRIEAGTCHASLNVFCPTVRLFVYGGLRERERVTTRHR